MLLQTNSYVVPKEKRAEHERLMRRFRQTLGRLGCDYFEVYEQVGVNWSGGESSGRYVQIMRFRDRKHQLAVQNAEKTDAAAQSLIGEFCALVNFEYQQQRGLFAVGFYHGLLPAGASRSTADPLIEGQPALEDTGALALAATAGSMEIPAQGEVMEPPAGLTVDIADEMQFSSVLPVADEQIQEPDAAPMSIVQMEPEGVGDAEKPFVVSDEQAEGTLLNDELLNDELADVESVDDELAELPPQEEDLNFADDTQIRDLELPHGEQRRADNS